MYNFIATLEGSYKIDDDYLSLIVSPVSKQKKSYYFDKRFNIYYRVKESIKNYYPSDDLDVSFAEEVVDKNFIQVKFFYKEKSKEILDFLRRKFMFSVLVDKLADNPGCQFCKFRTEIRGEEFYCQFYNKRYMKMKQTCVGFKEEEE